MKSIALRLSAYWDSQVLGCNYHEFDNPQMEIGKYRYCAMGQSMMRKGQTALGDTLRPRRQAHDASEGVCPDSSPEKMGAVTFHPTPLPPETMAPSAPNC